MPKLVAVLHNIRSLHNVGSIFRTADAAGFSKIYLSGITPSPQDRLGNYRAPLAKVSLGAEKYVPWQKVKSTLALLRQLKRASYYIVALEQSPAAKNIFTYNLPPETYNLALIVGHETRGLSPAILRQADAVLEIPMQGKKESLNVSVAFGIAAYHLRKNIF